MIFLSEDNMASGPASYQLRKDNLYNRTIRVTRNRREGTTWWKQWIQA